MYALRSKAEGDRGPVPARAVDQHVGARMRERRIMLGLTQQQMADELNIVQSAINNRLKLAHWKHIEKTIHYISDLIKANDNI